ncbi:MAG TPA: hypothetical protein VKS01_05285 [Bryobacteraceae bacterium]|nr:hypothetical protein [Bryobacteraceae bacterium]
MKTKLAIILLLLASATVMSAGPRVFVGFGVGVGHPYYGYHAYPYGGFYAPPVAYNSYLAYPGPGYSWVGGYWYPYGARYAWRAGAWVRPPYARAVWVGPRYYGGRFYRGYWRR